MRRLIRSTFFVAVFSTLLDAPWAVGDARAQTPQPFPRPGGEQTRQAPPPAPPPAGTAAQSVVPAAPAADTLGIPLYPTAQLLASYDAGRGQRYYIFGTTAAYAEVVGYYRTQLDSRGDEVFEVPATHMFSGGALGRYREETMAFPPSVTVKDWTSTGSQGYPNPKLGGEPARFPTIIMIVPAPAAAAAR
jgi:hypothetical protein